MFLSALFECGQDSPEVMARLAATWPDELLTTVSRGRRRSPPGPAWKVRGSADSGRGRSKYRLASV